MAIERIRWIPHAVRGVEARSAITRAMVEAAILHPDEEVRDDAHVGRRIAHKLITDGGRTYLLRVFYETEADTAIVISCYRTSQIGRYWRGDL